MLPSDSLIYADDVDQAYAQTRLKSRYQQTSFELQQSRKHKHNVELQTDEEHQEESGNCLNGALSGGSMTLLRSMCCQSIDVLFVLNQTTQN